MEIASLGYRTDLMMLRLMGSEIEEDGGLVIVRTPSSPGFWWGNFVLAPGPGRLPDAHEHFLAAFPAATHVAIGIDGTDGAAGIEAAAAARGLTLERAAVLSADRLGPPSHPAADADCRRLASDDDYAQCLQLHCDNNPADGRAFHAARIAAWRALQDAGHGHWFGAFVDGRLRSGLGLFTDGSAIARFQAVDTHPDFRRRGLASTLLRHAALDGLSWPGVRRLVIVAEPKDDVVRIYRTVGFAGDELQVQAVKHPPEYGD